METFNDILLTENIIIIVIGLVLAFLIIKFVVKTLIRIILLVAVIAGAVYLLYYYNIELPPGVETTIQSIEERIKQ